VNRTGNKPALWSLRIIKQRLLSFALIPKCAKFATPIKTYLDINEFTGAKNPVVTIGTFDGVHVGHQAIIKTMLEEARKIDGETVLVTFDPHPRVVIHPDSKNLKFITTQRRKFELLEKLGIHHLIIIKFTREFAKTSSADFIRYYLVEKIGCRKLIVGYDHHFGKNRLGDFNTMYDLGNVFGFDVERVAAQDVKNIAVSSTKIRKALEEGKIHKANSLLGYVYSITGKVVEGQKIGRKIGFPTANIEVEDVFKLIAANGVYASKIEIKGQFFNGMSNIGVRPTLNGKDLTIEVNIFDFNRDIYGETISIFFVDRIRDEKRFENLTELKKQLQRDRTIVLNILK